MIKVVDFAEINEGVVKIKNYRKKFVTNFYPNREVNEIWISNDQFYKIEISEVVLFLKKNSGFCTLFFIASSIEELDKSLSYLKKEFGDIVIVLDIVQKDENSDLLNVFYNQTFNLYTSLVRMNRINYQVDLSTVDIEGIFEAKANHLISIGNMFTTFFDEKAEQVPDEKQLLRWIENGNILIYEENNVIGGFLIYEVIGNTLYLRYWFVHPNYREKRIGSKLFNVFERNGKNSNRHLFWVIRSNENAIKRYRHFGFVEEKMYNFVLINKNIKYEE